MTLEGFEFSFQERASEFFSFCVFVRSASAFLSPRFGSWATHLEEKRSFSIVDEKYAKKKKARDEGGGA